MGAASALPFASDLAAVCQLYLLRVLELARFIYFARAVLARLGVWQVHICEHKPQRPSHALVDGMPELRAPPFLLQIHRICSHHAAACLDRGMGG